MTALLSHKATVLTKDVQGCTALHLAASRGHAEILSRMLSAADHINSHHPISDCHGFTPTHWAAYHGAPITLPLKSGPSLYLNSFFFFFFFNKNVLFRQVMKTVWKFYLNSNHVVSRRGTPSPHCTVLCESSTFTSFSHVYSMFLVCTLLLGEMDITGITVCVCVCVWFLPPTLRINGHSGSAEILLNSSFAMTLVHARDAKGRSVKVLRYVCYAEGFNRL